MYVDTRIGRNFVRISVERCLVICHGLPYEPGSVVEKSYYELARFFSTHIPALIFDFSGTGLSEGKFSLLNWVDDIVSIAKQFEKILLLGYSMGGAVAIRAACELDNVEKLAVVASPCCSEMFGEDVLKAIYENARAKNILKGLDSYNEFAKSFVKEFEEIAPINWIGKIDVPKLIVHGTEDTIVPFKHGERLFEAAKEPKMFVRVVGGDHFLRQREDVSKTILDWFEGKNVKVKI